MALSFEEQKPEINTHLKYLKQLKNVIDDQAWLSLYGIFEITFKQFSDPRAFGLYLVNEGFGQLFLDLWKRLSKYTKKNKRDSKGYQNLSMLLSLIWNTSDQSQDFGDDLVSHGYVSILLTVIKEGRLDEKLLAGGILGSLNNIIRLSNHNRTAYRNANAIDILRPLLTSENVQIQTKALIVLAYVVNENEREILATSKSGLKQLLVLLQEGVEDEDHSAYIAGTGNSFSVFETLDAINQLAINDTTKTEIEKQGAIPAIIRMLQDDFSDDEHRVAVEALWNLSFVESIRDSGILQSTLLTLEKLVKSSNKEVQRVCAAAIWQIKGSKSEDVHPSEATPRPPSYYEATTEAVGSSKSASAKVMLSYQWDYQKRILKIREKLENVGYRVWMDVSNMEGDILGAMANAVEESDVILMCMSERYRDSKSCRSEATYAYKLEKKIIPLLLEPEYKPDGWLGLLQGMDLYYACHTDEELDRSMPALLKVISESAPTRATDLVDGPITPTKQPVTQSSSPGPASPPAAAKWSAKEVQDWLREKRLKCPELEDFEGCDLQELHTSLIEDVRTFKNEMKSEYGMNGPTCTRFTAALRKLF